MRTSFLFRLLSLALCLASLIPPGVSSAAGTGSGFLRLEIPQKLGFIDEIYEGRDGRRILFIQDAHDSLEAQLHISDLIQTLVRERKIRTVFEEGYQGPVPARELFGDIRDETLRTRIAHYLLDRLRLGAAEYAHITGKTDYRLVGVDLLTGYLEELAAYRRAAGKQAAVGEDLRQLRSVIRRELARGLPPAKWESLKLRERFESGQMEPFDFFLRMVSAERPLIDSFPYLKSIAERVTEVGPDRTGGLGVVEPEMFLRELDALQTAWFQAAAGDSGMEEWLLLDDVLAKAERLSRLELDAASFSQLKKKLRRLDTNTIAGILRERLTETVLLPKAWETAIRDARRFYELTETRDRHAVESMQAHLKKSGEKEAILIFGGFHRERICELLRAEGTGYVIIVPRMAAGGGDRAGLYRELMAHGNPFFQVPLVLIRGARVASALLSPDVRSELKLLVRAARDLEGVPSSLLVRRIEENLGTLASSGGESRRRSELRNSGNKGRLFDRLLRGERSWATASGLHLTFRPGDPYSLPLKQLRKTEVSLASSEGHGGTPAFTFVYDPSTATLHQFVNLQPGIPGLALEVMNLLAADADERGLPLTLSHTINPKMVTLLEKVATDLEVEFRFHAFEETWSGSGEKPLAHAPLILGDREERRLRVFNKLGSFLDEISLRREGDHFTLSRSEFFKDGHEPFRIEITGDSYLSIRRDYILDQDQYLGESASFFVPVEEANPLLPFLRRHAAVHPLTGKRLYRLSNPYFPMQAKDRLLTAEVYEDQLWILDPAAGKRVKSIEVEMPVRAASFPYAQTIRQKISVNDALFRLEVEGVDTDEIFPLLYDRELWLTYRARPKPLPRSELRTGTDVPAQQKPFGAGRSELRIKPEEIARFAAAFLSLDIRDPDMIAGVRQLYTQVLRVRRVAQDLGLSLPASVQVEFPDRRYPRGTRSTTDDYLRFLNGLFTDQAVYDGLKSIFLFRDQESGVSFGNLRNPHLAALVVYGALEFYPVKALALGDEHLYLDPQYRSGILDSLEHAIHALENPFVEPRAVVSAELGWVAGQGYSRMVIERLEAIKPSSPEVRAEIEGYIKAIRQIEFRLGRRSELRKDDRASDQLPPGPPDYSPRIQHPVSFVIEAATVNRLQSVQWQELLALKVLNRSELKLLIVGSPDAVMSERIQALLRITGVRYGAWDPSLRKGDAVFFFSDLERGAAAAEALDPRTRHALEDSFALFDGAFGTALLYAWRAGNLPGLRNVNGLKHDPENIYGGFVLDGLFRQYALVAAAA